VHQERRWAHCGLCPYEEWLPYDELVHLKKPVEINGEKVQFLCKEHAQQLLKRLKQSRGETSTNGE